MKTGSSFFCFCAAMLFTGFLSGQSYSIYVSDARNFQSSPWQILKFDENGQNGQVFIDDHLAWPQDIFFLEQENKVLISNLNNGRISAFDAGTGAFIGEFATGIGGPTRMSLGPDSLLYVLQWGGNGKVRRYTLSGNYLGEFTQVGVGTSIGLDWDQAGNLYVSSYNGKHIRKFGPDGADLGLFVSSNLAGPTNIWFADNGDLLVIDYNGGAVKRFDALGNYLGVFISSLPQGEGVAFLPDGNLLIGVGGDSSVRKYSASGVLLGNWIAPGTLNLLTPNAVVTRPQPATNLHELYSEIMLVKPSAGARFQWSSPEAGLQKVDLFNSAGMLVRTLTFTDNSYWEASELPAGVYHLSTKLATRRMGKQTIIITH